MRILVYPHAMEIGGAQLNAVQLAAAVRDLGHEVTVLSEPGPLVGQVKALGLPHVEIPLERRRPSAGVARTIGSVIDDRGIDVVHSYEWPPALEGLAATASRRAALVSTVMSMSVVPFFPRTIPLTVGTEQIREAAMAAGHTRVSLLEPPIDTESDHPGVDGSAWRAEHGFDQDVPLIAMVCRLVPELKLEGLLAACDAVGQLASAGRKLRLAIVGDGRARDEIAARAARANDAAGCEAITLTGEVADPRPAYAAADILIGMGGSALRGMAFGKPLVVVGEKGYSELLTPKSAPIFLKAGWYGQGPGSMGSGASALREALDTLIEAPERRAELGGFARDLVVERFSLQGAASFLERVYTAALAQPTPRPRLAADSARSAVGLFGYKVHRKVQQLRGTARTDDANAAPVLARPEGK